MHFERITELEMHTEVEKRQFTITGERARKHANLRWQPTETIPRENCRIEAPRHRERKPAEPRGMPFDMRAKLDPWCQFAYDQRGNLYEPGIYANGKRSLREGYSTGPEHGFVGKDASFLYARDTQSQGWSTPLFKTRLARDIARNSEIGQGFLESFNSRQAGADKVDDDWKVQDKLW
jgi:hypothetical protein